MPIEKSIRNPKEDDGAEAYDFVCNPNKLTKDEIKELCNRIKPLMRGEDIGDKVLAEFRHGKQFVDKTAAKPVELRVEESGIKTYTYKRITTRADDNELYYIEDGDPFTSAFSWNPVPIAIAEGLVEKKRIRTYHQYSYEGFFKPTRAEVVCQIPAEFLEAGVAVAYTVRFLGVLYGSVGGLHEAETVIYGKK